MSASESTVQPTFLRQQPPYDPKSILDLYDLLTWFRGDMRIGIKLAALSLVASASGAFFIEPPDDTEEWEIAYVMANDRNGIDPADQCNFYYIDQIVTALVDLQQSTMSGSNVTAGNRAVFPNRDTTQGKISIVTSMTDQGFIVKRRDSKTSWLQLGVKISASVTVGTRTVDVYWVYRRRRLK